MAAITFCFVPICFYLDVGAGSIFQNTLGVGAWLCLFVLLAGESLEVRIQVGIAVAFATIGEYFASVYMMGYVYQFENVPAFVPPGHGLVYLTAVVLGRSMLFMTKMREITQFVFVLGAGWSAWGVTASDRLDVVGLVLFVIFVVCVLKGPSPRVYLGAFFITSWLEIVGTTLGTWSWAVIDPASMLPQGNPPSGVAAWYCLVDTVAIVGAPRILTAWRRITSHPVSRRRPAVEISLLLSRFHAHKTAPVFALLLLL